MDTKKIIDELSIGADAREYVFPYPPKTGNHQHGQTRGHRRFLLPCVIAWQDECADIIRRTGPAAYSQGEYFAVYQVWQKDRRKRDFDNLCKVINDALQRGGALLDDGQIAFAVFDRVGVDKDAPRVVITIGRRTRGAN